MREVPPGNGIGLVTPSVYCISGSSKAALSLEKALTINIREHQPYSKYRV